MNETKSASTRLLPWACLIGFLAVLVVNALSAALPINGRTPGEISDSIQNLFVPAGLTFTIWGAIYLGLLAFAIHLFRRPEESARTAAPYLLSCAANVAWILLWHYGQVALSLVAMLVLLGSLLWIDRRLEAARLRAPDRTAYWMAVVPFRIYLGWISVATIANATALLVTLGWNRFGLTESFWTIAAVVVAALLSLARLLLLRDVAFPAVVLWAFAGILVRHLTTIDGLYRGIVGTVSVLFLLLFSGICVTFAGNLRRRSLRKDGPA